MSCRFCRSKWSKSYAYQTTNLVIFPPLVGKQRGKSGYLVGNDMNTDDYFKYNVKTAFERDICEYTDVMEVIFRDIFKKLGLTGERIDHPILITECVGNPIENRKRIITLLFDTFKVPAVCFGVDALFSFKKQNLGKNGIILSSGFNSSFVIPYLGEMDIENTRRVSIGGFDCTDFMLRLLQMKFPLQRLNITVSKVEWMKRGFCVTARDFIEELRKLEDREMYNQFTQVFQLLMKSTGPSEETVDKRKIQGEKLKVKAQERREQKKFEEQEKLARYLSIQEIMNEDPDQFTEFLEQEGLEDENQLLKEIKKLKKKFDVKVDDSVQIEEVGSGEDKIVTDEQSEKSPKAKMLDGAKKAREKKKAEKQREDDIASKKQKIEDEFKTDRPEEWLALQKENRTNLITKLERIRIFQAELKDKRSNVSKQRLKALASSLDAEVSEQSRAASQKEKDIYNKMLEDSEMADETKIEEEINKISREIAKKEEEMGLIKNDFYSYLFEPKIILNEEQQNQIHMTLERIRVPELIFQPHMIGITTVGIIQLLEYVLKRLPKDQQRDLVKNIYICGGNFAFSGMKERIEAELLSILPFRSEFHVTIQSNSEDAWFGAASFALDKDFLRHSITKKDYSKNGPEHFIPHPYSNRK